MNDYRERDPLPGPSYFQEPPGECGGFTRKKKRDKLEFANKKGG